MNARSPKYSTVLKKKSDANEQVVLYACDWFSSDHLLLSLSGRRLQSRETGSINEGKGLLGGEEICR